MYFHKLIALILLATIAVSNGTEVEVTNLNFYIYIICSIHQFNYFARLSINSLEMLGHTPTIGQFWSTRHVFGSIIGMWRMCCPFIDR